MKNGVQVGAMLQSMRKIYDHCCIVCTDPFRGYHNAMFCSNACKQRDKNIRKKAATGDRSSIKAMARINRRKAEKL